MSELTNEDMLYDKWQQSIRDLGDEKAAHEFTKHVLLADKRALEEDRDAVKASLHAAMDRWHETVVQRDAVKLENENLRKALDTALSYFAIAGAPTADHIRAIAAGNAT